MTECQRCGGKSADAFLCGRCCQAIDSQLRELPWWQERLTETAQGRTRMTDNGGRKSAARKDLDGAKPEAAYIELLPGCKHGKDDDCDCDLSRARRARAQAALAHALATGRVNAKASQLLAEIADQLSYWVRTLCESRGIPVPQLPPGRTLGAPQAIWLAAHIQSIALSEDAGDFCADLEGRADVRDHKRRPSIFEQIEQVINRPIRFWPLGPCPAEVKGDEDGEDGQCGAELPRVPERTDEVTCRKCRTRHVVSRVLLIRKHEREGSPQTWRELCRYNADLPPEFQVPARTLRHWRQTGALIPCDATAEDPLYSWIDVRLLMLDSKRTSVTRRARRGRTDAPAC